MSAAALDAGSQPAPPPRPLDPTGKALRRAPVTVYKPFFTAAIAVTLTLGAGWGAWLLWRIGFAHSFTGVSVHAVNAHGLAQVYGWVGLFIVGFAYQFFPRLLHAPSLSARQTAPVFALQLGGLALATLALDLAGTWSLARPAALVGGLTVAAAATWFARHMRATFRAAAAPGGVWRWYAGTAIAFFVASTLASAFHAWITMGASTKDELVQAVGTWQAPLRDLQVHGMALFMILGVSLRLLPALLGVPAVPEPRARRAYFVLLASVVGETALFLAYRLTGQHWIAALLLLPWLGLFAGAAMIAASLRLWGPFKDDDRTNKFLRAAYAWLFVSLAMLLLLPAYQALVHIPFSHAWYGATRHAITVGFVSLMIMGMGARFTAALNAHDRFALSRLVGPFVLVNVGCLLRVTLQVATDWVAVAYVLVGISSLLELAGLTWWGAHVIGLMRRRRAA